MIPAVVLAAGGSRRLGKPKQLVRRHGQSLVRRTVTVALGAGCAPVVVVLGAHADAVRVALAGLDVVTLVNPDWQTGLASSLRVGVGALIHVEPPPAGVLLLVSDQPAIGSGLLARLVGRFDGRPGRRVGCRYGGTVGVPAIFEATLFPRLMQIRGDHGAKRLLTESSTDLATVDWPEGGVDIDLPQDLDE